MRNYIILNNQRSDEISGLIIQELAPISKPLQRTQVETIDGRDGDIITPLGYAAYNKKIKIGLYGNFNINDIIAYFATKGTAIFSNEPDKYYNYQIVDQIDYERLVRYKVATVTMHVQPFKYSATEGTITVDASDTVSGEGSEIALNNTAEAPFNTLRHKGNATQKTYTGKNLCSSAYYESSNTGHFIVNKANLQKTFTLSYASDVTAPDAYIYLFTDGTNRGSLNVKIQQTAGTRRSVTITLGDQNYGYIQAATNVWFTSYAGNAGHTVDAIVTDAQIENGSSMSDYEPYVGGTASPNPDYPQDISLLTGDSTITIDDGGENSQSYVIPFGDTYLAAIGDYADEPVKVGDTWYIRRAIGKVDLSTLTWTGGTAAVGRIWTTTSITDVKFVSVNTELGAILATDYTPHTASGMYNTHGFIAIDITNVKATNNTGTPSGIAYYALATPVDEEITDQDLIDALDDFYDQAHSYKGHTHITATAADGNAPAVLSVEVGEDNESTVTNTGNTTSRPILTIYGQGDIGVYINDVEVLDIELGDEGYITLDSVEMEAYKDNTANLKNRLVTGDYSKLALNAGANKIRFTGIVTKYEISKYSRWL